MKKNCIIIPIYKESPGLLDKLSLESLSKNLKDFSDYEVYFIYPENLGTAQWKRYVDHDVILRPFPYDYFLSTLSYSNLLESYEFWNTFEEHEYALIYQTDGYCIGGSLKEYIDMNYDYIGAPIITQNSRWFNVPAIGNGGVSLRKIATMIEVTDSTGEFIRENKEDIAKHNRMNSNMYSIYEDLYFAQLVPMLWDFRKPNFDIATSFAYDMNADIVYEMTKHKLPLFIHAFDKNIRFWQNILDDFKDIDVISECEIKNENEYLSERIGYQANLPHVNKIKIAAIMIVKNENYHLNEQISKIISSGVSKVFVIDNNDISGEDPKDILDFSNVELISKYRGEHEILSEAYSDVYNNYLNDFTHCIFIDGDEEIHSDSLRKTIYDNIDSKILKIKSIIVYNDGNRSSYQNNAFKTIMKCGLPIINFTRETPLYYIDSKEIPEEVCCLHNYVGCNSLEEYMQNKLYRGYPDKETTIGKQLTSMDLYYKVNPPKNSRIYF